MFERFLQLPRGHSCFLFGARGTGKTTFIKRAFDPDASLYFIYNTMCNLLSEPLFNSIFSLSRPNYSGLTRFRDKDIWQWYITELSTCRLGTRP